MEDSLPAIHYDKVTQAWKRIVGEHFHYGIYLDDERADSAGNLDRATERLNEWMLAEAGPREGARVLDVGCGIGGPARWLADRIGAQVVGISTSAEGIHEATRLSAGRTPLPRFEVADAVDNGQPDASFDLVWVMESSHLMPDKAAVLAECARVLRPGGHLVLCDLVVPRPFTLQEVFALREDFNCLDRAFGRAKMVTLDDYRGFAEAAGLEVVRTRDLTHETRPSLEAWQIHAKAHPAELATSIGADGVEDWVRACGILDRLWGEGRMGYGLIHAKKAE